MYCGSISFKGSVYPKFPREMNVYNYDKNLVMYGDILHGNIHLDDKARSFSFANVSYL